MGKSKKKKRFIMRVIDEIFPYIQKNKANKSLQKKINSIKDYLSYDDRRSVLKMFKSPEEADLNILNDMLEDNKHRMERLEDKAKVQIVGITIANSIIFGVAGNLKNISHNSTCFKWVMYAVLIVSVIYMSSSGLEAINMLINKNYFYYLPYNFSELEDDKKRRSYNAIIVKNQLQNTIRNNAISTSYTLMRNAILLLILVFAVWIIPIG